MTPEASSAGARPAGPARSPAGRFARRFGDLLRAGDGAAATEVVDEALAAGMSPEAVQVDVVTPAMWRIGELWQSRVISVADEHLATAISQGALIRLFESMSEKRVPARSRERILLAAVEGQQHTLGLRMTADVLEASGFDVLYLGESVPVDGLLESVEHHRPHLVGLAYGIAADVSRLADSLWSIHQLAPHTRVMLGGSAVPPGLRTECYPYVTDTTELIAAVETLLAGPSQPLPPVIEALRSGGTPRAWPRRTAIETDAISESLAKTAEESTELAREHVRRARAFRDLAFRDPLTGLPNRRAFEDEMSALVEDATAGGAVLMIDVDGFKAVNDGQGHDAGDRLLRTIGEVITRAVRPGDLAARVGGDEFAVVLPGASVTVAGDIGRRICAEFSDGVTGVSVSVGVAALTGDARAALLSADSALYEAKAAGRHRVVEARGPARVTEGR